MYVQAPSSPTPTPLGSRTATTDGPKPRTPRPAPRTPSTHTPAPSPGPAERPPSPPLPPQVIAEQYFPRLEVANGIPVSAVDLEGRVYNFKWRFWVNNSSRMYLLEVGLGVPGLGVPGLGVSGAHRA